MLRGMTEFQVLATVGSLIGLMATVLNLVTFFREKERGHVKAGLVTLGVLMLLGSLAFVPRFFPGVRQSLAPYLPATQALSAPAQAAPVQGSFAMDLRRNLLGGVDGLFSDFRFVNPGDTPARVISYEVRMLNPDGSLAHTYTRVLAEPIEVAGHAHVSQQVEMDQEIRDSWQRWTESDAGKAGALEVSWSGSLQGESSQLFTFTSRNG